MYLSFPVFAPQYLVATKCDLVSQKVVDTARGQALANEFGMKFFETSAKEYINVDEVFNSMLREIEVRLMAPEGAAVIKARQVWSIRDRLLKVGDFDSWRESSVLKKLHGV